MATPQRGRSWTRSRRARPRGSGHVLVNSNIDRPWSQYFCCMVAAHREFVRRHPVATKRALRAILKATDVCAVAPERASRELVDRGRTPSYDLARQVLKDIPYDRWREYNPEDTLRFYALRLREAGMITSTPQKIIAEEGLTPDALPVRGPRHRVPAPSFPGASSQHKLPT